MKCEQPFWVHHTTKSQTQFIKKKFMTQRGNTLEFWKDIQQKKEKRKIPKHGNGVFVHSRTNIHISSDRWEKKIPFNQI